MQRNIFNDTVLVKTNGAILTPQLTNADITGLSPQAGQIAYNKDTGKLIVYGSSWENIITSGSSSLTIGNLLISGNTISATNTNGDVILSPAGLGLVRTTKPADFGSNAVSGITTLSCTTVSATTLAGTLNVASAAQPNITSLGTQAAALNMGNNKITSVATPTLSTDAATKGYADTLVGSYLPLAGGTMSGAITGLTNLTMSGTISGATVITASAGVNAGNLSIGPNAIVATNSNGNVSLSPNGTGSIIIGNLSIKTNVITSLLGDITLTPQVGSNISCAATLAMGSNNITSTGTVSCTTLTATNVGGTLSTNAQPNITSLGTQVAALNMGTNNITNAGTITGTTLSLTNNPYMIRKKYSQSTVATATNVLLPWDVPSVSNGITYTDTGIDFYFTVPTAGIYTITYNIIGILTSTTQAESWITINTPSPADSSVNRYGWSGSYGNGRFNCTAVISLSAGAAIRTVYWQNTGSNQLIPQLFDIPRQMFISIIRNTF